MRRLLVWLFSTVVLALGMAACRDIEPPELADIAVDCAAVNQDEAGLVSGQELAFDGTAIDTTPERNINSGFQRALIDDGQLEEDEEWDEAELEALDLNISRLDSGEEIEAGEIWPWTTFEVHAWFTKDHGQKISIWTAGLDIAPGERWLIAGPAFAAPEGLGGHSAQSGMAAACASRRYSVSGANEWELMFDGSVSPGSGEPDNEPDPRIVAEVQARRSEWEQSGLAGYTLSGYGYFGGEAIEDGCTTRGRVRLVIQGEDISQAINTTDTCTIREDSDGLWTVNDMFDMAAIVSGSQDWDIEWAEHWPYPRRVYGYDRSFEAEVAVQHFHPRPIPGHFGTDLLEAVEENRALWESRGVGDYTVKIVIDCFCPPEIVSPITVMVSDGEIVRTIQDGEEVDPSSLQFAPLTIEQLFEVAGRPTRNVVAGFDPEYGYPVDIYDEGERNTIDDEIGYYVAEFEAAPIDLTGSKRQPPSDPSAVASDIPEVWQAEVEELRLSARPGRVVGFVHLTGETSTGFPLAETQPFCTGFGEFADVVPGAPIAVYGTGGNLVGEGTLRGSAFDGHVGCVLWFGVDVTVGIIETIAVASHRSDSLDSTGFAAGEIVNLWGERSALMANCELIPDPFTNCISLSADD